MNAARYDAIVIGAGPNGLVAAAYLARSGQRVLLLERRHETGGGLNTDEYFGFRLNLHAVYHLMAERMPAHTDLGLHELGVHYLRPPVVAAFPFADGSSLVFTRDPEECARSIGAFSAPDAERYLRMWNEFTPIMDEYLLPMTWEAPLPALDQLAEFAATPTGRTLARISEQSILEVIDGYGFEHPRVRLALLSFAVMWGVDLDEPVGFLYPIYLTRMLDAAFVKGGSHRVSSALLRALLAAGGEVRDAAEVVAIRMQGGRAAGVRLASGEEIAARAVVSTLNPQQTFQQLLEPEAVPRTLAQAVAGWEWERRSLFGLHLGFAKAPGIRFRAADPRVDEAMIVFAGIESDEELLDHLDDLDRGVASGAEWLHLTLPSRFDATMAPPGNALARIETLARYDTAWRERAAAHGDACLATLARYADVDTAAVVLRRENTPLDIEQRLVTMHRGSYKHGAYTSLQLGYLRPNDQCSCNETPIEGLFVGGASTYPGGMILGGPGYLAAATTAEYLGATMPTGFRGRGNRA
ncbi:MAG: NAD(P)/FAD-dependent oxidoreductase [Pseudomonadales bacterium]|nr:NAD(P)/FAD-dependent oxidoreductase [Pseudomonadales bacterium]